MVGGCPFSDWGSWEASLVEEGSEEKRAGRNFHAHTMAGSILANSSEQLREMHNIHVNRTRHDIEEIMTMEVETYR